jgi:hypothetical protein
VIAFWIDERVGAGFQADGTFKVFLKKFLEGCKKNVSNMMRRRR